MSATQHTPPHQLPAPSFFGMMSGSPFMTPPTAYAEESQFMEAGFQHNYKTKPCRHFDAGKCKLGGLCNFAHGDAELKLYRRKAHEGDDAAKSSPLKSSTPNRPAHLLSNSSKIVYLEKYLDNFYETQKNLLERVKFLSLSLSAKSAGKKNVAVLPGQSDDQVGLSDRSHGKPHC